MAEGILERGLRYIGKKLHERINYYSKEELVAKLKHFSIKKIAVLIDGKTDLSSISSLEGIKISGYYSFDLNNIGMKINGFVVQPLLPDGGAIAVDGWIVSAVNKFAGYSLSQYLLKHSVEKQVIIQHVKAPEGTVYYSYIDFFSNEQRTMVQIHNYFDRCYRIPFPLDIRLTLRNDEGVVLETSQVIIPPNGIRVITSDDFEAENFVGYLEVEFEVTTKVMPFLHYYANYISKDFISNNHQSGLGLHPANSAFTRGYIPTNEDESLVVCLFQRNYSNPVNVKAVLRFTENGEQKTLEKSFSPVKKNQMLYQDVKELFPELDFTKVNSPYVDVLSEEPLHRPNYYYVKKGKEGYYDTSHAGPDPKVYSRNFGAALETEERKKIQDMGCCELELKQFILPREMNIDSLIWLGNDTTADIKEFVFDFYNCNGELLHSFEETFDYHKERSINLNEYLRNKGVNDFSGSVSMRAAQKAKDVPVVMNGISAYVHQDNPYVTSTAAEGAIPDNIPFYFRSAPPTYVGGDCTVGVTDIFGPGISSNEYDTYFAVMYPCSNKKLSENVNYEIQIMNTEGEKRIIYRTIAAHGCDYFKLSDLVAQTNHSSKGGYYTLWFFAVGAHLYSQRILMRKSDSAISLEHCYPGKYGL